MASLDRGRAQEDASASKPSSRPAATKPTDSAPDEEVTYVSFTKRPSRKQTKIDDEQPLVDLTADLTLRSKKTVRQQKRQQAKGRKNALKPSLMNLPSELILQILSFLRPSDLFRLQRVNRWNQHVVQQNEKVLAQTLISRRYDVLFRCFPTPVAFTNVEPSLVPALISPRRQQMLRIHRIPYQHVQPCSFHQICTCLTCVLAWNNLCMIVDLSHWQHHLGNREPIPMIPRGQNPIWNQKLIAANAEVVFKAMQSPLWHASILEKHLSTTTSAISRTSKRIVPGAPATPRLYSLTDAEAAAETDVFLERHGPPSYEFPYHRDNYYSLEAYIPNRKWDKETSKWRYFQDWNEQHMRDLNWTNEWYRGNEQKLHSALRELQRPIDFELSKMTEGAEPRAPISDVRNVAASVNQP